MKYEYTVRVESEETGYHFVKPRTFRTTNYEKAADYARYWFQSLYSEENGDRWNQEANEKYGAGKCHVAIYRRRVGEWEEIEREDAPE